MGSNFVMGFGNIALPSNVSYETIIVKPKFDLMHSQNDAAKIDFTATARITT